MRGFVAVLAEDNNVFRQLVTTTVVREVVHVKWFFEILFQAAAFTPPATFLGDRVLKLAPVFPTAGKLRSLLR